MKKILLSIVLCSISIVGMSQKDVTKFLGIPVDGSKNEMIQKLKAKGFSQNPYVKDVLTGMFNGESVNIAVVTNNDKVYRIGIADANGRSETDIRIRFNTLYEQFLNNQKYILGSIEKIPDDEDISYEMKVNKKRYEAVFFQRADTTSAEYQALFPSKLTKEQLQNPSDEISKNDIKETVTEYILEKSLKKVVWFMIGEDYGTYSIYMYYDNVYNKANGEDL